MNMISYQTIEQHRGKLLLATRALVLLVGAMIIIFPPQPLGTSYLRLFLIGLGLQALFLLSWMFGISRQKYALTAARFAFIFDLAFAFFVEYPAARGGVVFALIPGAILISSLLVFEERQAIQVWIPGALFLTISTVLTAWQAAFAGVFLNFIGQVAAYSLIGWTTFNVKHELKNLEGERDALQQQLKKASKERNEYYRQLRVLQEGTRGLSKDVKRKSLEIQNIITLSEQIHLSKDSREILRSFLLTALGQMGSSHGFIMAREKRNHNYWGIIVEKGLRGMPVEDLRIYLDSNIIGLLRSFREPVFVKDIPRENLFADELNFISQFSQDVFCPIFVRNQVIGLVAFGKKVTELPYTSEDFNLISIVANQSAFVLDQVQQTDEYRDQFSRTIRAMLYALEAKFMFTRGHLLRTANYVTMAARRLGFTTAEVQQMGMGTLLHDIGKTAVNDKYLLYDRALGQSDRDQKLKERILSHALEGGKILKAAGFSGLMVDMALHHHEFFNGKGFPHRIGGEEIPIQTRILAVCNAYDAMTSERPYRKALPAEQAQQALHAQAGSQFDPEVVKAFLDVLKQKDSRQTYH